MDIKDLMTKDEYVVKALALKGRLRLRPDTKVWATNKRLIIDRSEYVREIGYQHISSMMIKETLGITFIIIGAITALIGALGLSNIIEFVSEILPDALSGALIVIGLLLVLFGLIKTKILYISVPGMNDPEKLSGARVDLEKVIVIVRDSNKQELTNERPRL